MNKQTALQFQFKANFLTGGYLVMASRVPGVAFAACVWLAAAASIIASSAFADTNSPIFTATDQAKSSDQASAKILGFRSALFGMDEQAVRAAIVKDFGVPASAIKQSQNLGDRTDVLTVHVPDVLPGGGASDIAYAFGYKSKKLTQISVVWSKGTDKAITPERLLANGEALKDYFQGAGYDPKSIVMNSAVRDGILLFRGADADGHTTAMMLHGTTVAGQEKGTQTFAPNALLLFYLVDPKAPDVFKIQAGRF